MMEATNRLAHFNPNFKPADSDRSYLAQPPAPLRCFPSPYNKPLYTKEEVQNIINRLHQSKHPDSTLKLKNPKAMYTAISLENIVASVHKRNGGDRCPMRRPHLDTETNEHVLHCSKKYSSADVQAITDRMYKYDSMKWPPESKNRRAKPSNKPIPPPPVDYVPPRKYTAKEIEAITQRMHKYDPQRWPPNSKDRKPKEEVGPRTYYATWKRVSERKVRSSNVRDILSTKEELYDLSDVSPLSSDAEDEK